MFLLITKLQVYPNQLRKLRLFRNVNRIGDLKSKIPLSVFQVVKDPTPKPGRVLRARQPQPWLG